MDSLMFCVGEKFDSFEAITEKLNCYCKSAFVHYWTRDSRKINGPGPRARHVNNLRLKYYSLKYSCVLGGQEHRSRGLGKRYSLSIRATNCPAYISFRSTKDGQYLEVVSVNNEHNHEQSEELFQALPQERKLPDEVKAEILDLIKLQVDKNRVKQYVKLVTQKIISSKDLTNLISSGRLESRPEITPARSNELLTKIYHHEVEASMLSGLEMESETSSSQSISLPKAKKRRRSRSQILTQDFVVNDTQDYSEVYDCLESEPISEIIIEPLGNCNAQSYEELSQSSAVSQQEEQASIDVLTEVVEDSKQYCVTCGQSIPKR